MNRHTVLRTGWATTAATTLAVIAGSVLVAALLAPAAWGSRLAGLVVAVAVAAAAREAARDDVLGWTITVAISALTLCVIVFPSILGIATTSSARPALLSTVLFASGFAGLAAAAGRALRAQRVRSHG